MLSMRTTTSPSLPTSDGVRVLHVHSGNLYGGVETFLSTMARHRAHASGVTMDFAVCFAGRIERELRNAGAAVHLLGAARIRSPSTVCDARRALERLLQAGRYDVVVTHSLWSHALFAPVVRRHGLRLVHHMHEVSDPRGWLDRWASLTSPDLVLTNSAFTRASGPWLFPNTPRHVVRCPSALGGPGDRTERAGVRASLGAADETVVIIQASRMQSWKGHRLLIEALAELRANPRWACWMAGGAQRPSELAYERQVREAVARRGLADRIHFLGQRDDVPSLMRAADIHCQPNARAEPFGLVFIEALAAGLPIVTTRMGGPLEIVDASCGVFVEPNSRSIAMGLRDLIDDDAKRAVLSKSGPGRARELCDPDTRTRDLGRELARVAALAGATDIQGHAALAAGRSGNATRSAVVAMLRERGSHFQSVVALGCRRRDWASGLDGLFGTYLACDTIAHDGFRESDRVRFRRVDLNRPPYPIDDACANAVVSVETIEHLENPRALVREMTRIVRPGGYVVVATPNQLSLTSKLWLVARNQFHAFQDAPAPYQTHITALVEEDLRRIASECGLIDVEIRYTDSGHIPLTAWPWPADGGAGGRWFSDNVVMVARRP
jgi:glycosyltransferase involved in cell wall biosynthesis